MHKAKEQAIKQWTNDPCGMVGAKGLEIGTKEFYQKIDQNRYQEYAPWMKQAMKFEQFQNQHVLEIGFGMGTDLFSFASSGATVSGVDLSPQHLEIATQRFNLYGLKANLQLADTESLPFGDATFDVVYSFGVIHHTPNTEKAVEEIYRVLKPGGQAILAVYHKNSIFHLCAISGYLLHMRFLQESYQDTLSRIEYRENSDARPLVKLYSRKEFQKLLHQFSQVEIDCFHLDKTHFSFLQGFVPNSLIKQWENKYGWYLVARARK
jgi:ubiquinone/menaquinone biosynthesis C-methylase UbiE